MVHGCRSTFSTTRTLQAGRVYFSLVIVCGRWAVLPVTSGCGGWSMRAVAQWRCSGAALARHTGFRRVGSHPLPILSSAHFTPCQGDDVFTFCLAILIWVSPVGALSLGGWVLPHRLSPRRGKAGLLSRARCGDLPAVAPGRPVVGRPLLEPIGVWISFPITSPLGRSRRATFQRRHWLQCGAWRIPTSSSSFWRTIRLASIAMTASECETLVVRFFLVHVL